MPTVAYAAASSVPCAIALFISDGNPFAVASHRFQLCCLAGMLLAGLEGIERLEMNAHLVIHLAILLEEEDKNQTELVDATTGKKGPYCCSVIVMPQPHVVEE